jgi:hypothetical protein
MPWSSPKTCASKTEMRAPWRQASRARPAFHARVLHELLGVPAVLGRDLRQQQTPTIAALDDQSVTTDFDLRNRGNVASRGEHREFRYPGPTAPSRRAAQNRGSESATAAARCNDHVGAKSHVAGDPSKAPAQLLARRIVTKRSTLQREAPSISGTGSRIATDTASSASRREREKALHDRQRSAWC